MAHSPRLRKYDLLSAHLAHQPVDDRMLTLSLTEIEAIIGAALPASALLPGFWSNYRGNRMARYWQQVGWSMARTHRHSVVYAVTFARVAVPKSQA